MNSFADNLHGSTTKCEQLTGVIVEDQRRLDREDFAGFRGRDKNNNA